MYIVPQVNCIVIVMYIVVFVNTVNSDIFAILKFFN